MSDWAGHVVDEKLSKAMKFVEKDMKVKKVSNKLNKKNSLYTSGVQDDLYWILQQWELKW